MAKFRIAIAVICFTIFFLKVLLLSSKSGKVVTKLLAILLYGALWLCYLLMLSINANFTFIPWSNCTKSFTAICFFFWFLLGFWHELTILKAEVVEWRDMNDFTAICLGLKLACWTGPPTLYWNLTSYWKKGNNKDQTVNHLII